MENLENSAVATGLEKVSFHSNPKERQCQRMFLKLIASPGSMHDTGCSGLVHWDDPEGWYGEGGGRECRMGNTCTPVVDSC